MFLPIGKYKDYININKISAHLYTTVQVAPGTAERARKTLPKGLSLSDSKIKHAGKGVWTDVRIAKFTRFGPYEGVRKIHPDVANDDGSGCGWEVSFVDLIC